MPFPDMKTVYRRNADATLIDFVDPDKMVVIHRRGLISYDVLIQPDILKIFRILDPSCPLQSRVDMSKKDAAAYADEVLAEIRRRYPSLEGWDLLGNLFTFRREPQSRPQRPRTLLHRDPQIDHHVIKVSPRSWDALQPWSGG